MKFYSELTRQLYDSEEKLLKAEEVVKEEENKKQKLKLEKENRKSEVDKAYEKFVELRTKYVQDYGIYVFKNEEDIQTTLLSMLPTFLR